MDLRQHWAQLLSVAEAPQSAADREAALATAMLLSSDVTASAVGCSITERVDDAYRTVTAANELSAALDQVQYDANAGPCLTAVDEGITQPLALGDSRSVYRAYGAAAIARGVHSSLSVPLPDPRRPAALNLYASAPDAFVSPRARAVAALLARCTATLLPGGAVVVVVPVADADLLDTVRARRIRMEQALRAVMVNEGVSRADAFALLVGRSGVERRSVHALVDDVVGSTDRTVAS